MPLRTVRTLHPATRDDIGDLHTWRPLPNERLEQIDPFLFLNHHGPQVYPPGNRGLPFGPHPHRGFETVTFIVEGSLAHRDSGGHESVIHAGGVQWMTAGRGLEHAEVSPAEFLREGGPLEILQLWINLPPALKMTEPRYVGLQKDEIAPIPGAGTLATVYPIAGSWDGHPGPISSLTGVAMATVSIQPRGLVTLAAPRGRSVFLYVVRGAVAIGGTAAEAFHLAEMNDDGDAISIEADTEALLLFGHAEPIGAPVVAHGPFVMNTREEILQAIRDYQSGKFGGLA
ncbi:MAG TPA: pirin family protein [Thermoanaerobaculia bacterium]|nr:pirin family protein [Thermoanaerobaculia bacterium]